MTLKEYAESRGISYQSAVQSFNRYKKDMSGMYEKSGKKAPTILNDQGVAFMDTKRQRHTVTVVSDERTTELDQLRNQLEVAKIENRMLQEDKEELRQKYDALQADMIQVQKAWKEESDRLRDQIAEEKERYIQLTQASAPAQIPSKESSPNTEAPADQEPEPVKKGLWGRILDAIKG